MNVLLFGHLQQILRVVAQEDDVIRTSLCLKSQYHHQIPVLLGSDLDKLPLHRNLIPTDQKRKRMSQRNQVNCRSFSHLQLLPLICSPHRTRRQVVGSKTIENMHTLIPPFPNLPFPNYVTMKRIMHCEDNSYCRVFCHPHLVL